jgi:hypothetical protein
LEDTHQEQLKDYIDSHKESMKNKILIDNNIKSIFIDKSTTLVSASLIAPFLYEIMPMPMKWLIPEIVFSYFVEDNIEFIAETLSID